MLAEDDYLRRLPIGIDLESRIAIEAIVFSSDAFLSAFAEIERLASGLLDNPESLLPSVHVALFSAAWTCVDQTHAIRQLLPSDARTNADSIWGGYFESTEPARRLRNAMDHLRSNLRNLASRKGTPAPIFGVLHVRGQAVKEPDGVVTIPTFTLLSGILPSGYASPSVSIDAQNLLQPGIVEFQAFGERVNLSQWASQLRHLLPSLSQSVATGFEAALTNDALSEADKDELRKPFGGGLFAAGRMKLREQGTDQTTG